MYLVNLRSGWKLSWIILFSIMLVVGWAITPAEADHCKGKHKNDPGCDGGGGEPPPVTDLSQELVTVQNPKNNASQIVVMNADRTNAQVVLKARDNTLSDVSWSGDGSKVLFRGNIDHRSGIHWVQVYELDENGDRVAFAPGEPQFVTAGGGLLPRWSPTAAPDGKEWIVFIDADPESGVSQVWLVDPYSPDKKIRLTQDTERTKGYPTWSPDAGRIGFLSFPAGVPCSCPGDVEILQLSADTGNLEAQDRISLIVYNPDAEVVKDQLKESWFFTTDWANNAEWIVTTNSRTNQFWVFPTSPADVEANAKAITDDPDIAYFLPAWSPRDDALIFIREGHGGACDIPDTSKPPLQGGPSSRVIARLVLDNMQSPYRLVICEATLPIEELGGRYEWWRGGVGFIPPSP